MKHNIMYKIEIKIKYVSIKCSTGIKIYIARLNAKV